MKWRVAHLGNDQKEQKRQIIAQFEQIYRAANEPKDVALFESNGQNNNNLYLNHTAIEYCDELFNYSSPWYEAENDSIILFNIHWVAGDQKLNKRS